MNNVNEVRENSDWPEPMPQSGVYPVEEIRGWLQLTREEFLERARRAGLVIDEQDCLEMADLIAYVRRNQEAKEEEHGHHDEA